MSGVRQMKAEKKKYHDVHAYVQTRRHTHALVKKRGIRQPHKHLYELK